MELQINRNEEKLQVRNITIFVEDKEFRISINNFNELIVNKENLGIGEGGIIIKPRVSNEIGLL